MIAIEYVGRVTRDECAPYADVAIARTIRLGYAGEDLRETFRALVTARKQTSSLTRTDRINRYLDMIEKGAPLSCDGGAESALRQNRATVEQLRRFHDEATTRVIARNQTIREFLDFFARHHTSKIDGKKHPGYLLLRSEPEDSPHRVAYDILRSELAAADMDEMAATVAHYEESGRILEKLHIQRIMKFPEVYPDLHARYRAALKRHILERKSVPSEEKRRRTQDAYLRRRAHRKLLTIGAKLKERAAAR
jgi:hypothetical protein